MRKLFLAIVCLAGTALTHAQQPASADAAWFIPDESKAAGFTFDVADDAGKRVATLIPPSAGSAPEGSFEIAQDAVSYRGKIVRLQASLRIESPRPGARTRLWMRIDRPAQAMSLLDDYSAPAVKSEQWTRSEITLHVAPDAARITFGVLSQGGARVQVRDVLITPVRSLSSLSALPAAPQNLRFQNGQLGQTPPGWEVMPESETGNGGYRAQTSRDGCFTASRCAVLISPESHAADAPFGALVQSFDASAYRGQHVEFRVKVRTEPGSTGNRARVLLRTYPATENLVPTDLIATSDTREVLGSGWAEIVIAHVVEPEAASISLGVVLEGEGRVWLDDASFGQQATTAEPAPDHEQQAKTVNAAARLALRYVQSLPDFLCTEVITRTQNEGKGWRNQDVLTIRVGFEGGVERYRLLTVNGKPSKASMRSLGGAQTEGEFGSLMEQLFQPYAASFRFERYGSIRNHAVSVYRFEVPLEKSAFRLGYGTQRDSSETLSAYHGFVFIDRASNEVLRIEQISDPPPLFPLLESTNVLDYDHSTVGGEQVLLPVKAETFMNSTTLSSHNVVEFRGYQKFSAEAKIQFE